MRRATALMSASLLAASAALAWGGSAVAASSPGDDRGEKSGVSASSEHQRIVDYWTPARRASAIPRDMVRPDSRAKGDRPGQGGGGSGGSGSVVTGSTWSDSTAPVAKTTGKVFFTLGGVRYVCSGSAVAGSVNLVLSAGHCVWDDAAEFASRWMFVPGYKDGSGPYGEWTATSLFTTANWAGAGNTWPDDAGMAVVTGGGATPLTSVLGTLPTMATASGHVDLAGAVYSAFGYPAAQKYKGNTLTYCQGPVQLRYDGEDTLSMACEMTGGSSGGPWFGAAGGTGEIVSVNSYGYSGLKRMFGPTFDSQESVMSGAAGDGECDAGEACVNVG